MVKCLFMKLLCSRHRGIYEIPIRPSSHLPFGHCVFPMRWSASLQYSSSLNKPDHEYDGGDDQQDMNESTHRVADYQSQKP